MKRGGGNQKAHQTSWRAAHQTCRLLSAVFAYGPRPLGSAAAIPVQHLVMAKAGGVDNGYLHSGSCNGQWRIIRCRPGCT